MDSGNGICNLSGFFQNCPMPIEVGFSNPWINLLPMMYAELQTQSFDAPNYTVIALVKSRLNSGNWV